MWSIDTSPGSAAAGYVLVGRGKGKDWCKIIKEEVTKIRVMQAEDERKRRDEGVEVMKEREAESPAGK